MSFPDFLSLPYILVPIVLVSIPLAYWLYSWYREGIRRLILK